MSRRSCATGDTQTLGEDQNVHATRSAGFRTTQLALTRTDSNGNHGIRNVHGMWVRAGWVGGSRWRKKERPQRAQGRQWEVTEAECFYSLALVKSHEQPCPRRWSTRAAAPACRRRTRVTARKAPELKHPHLPGTLLHLPGTLLHRPGTLLA